MFEEAMATGQRTFDEPWQAEAFALAVQLHEQGLFSWSEWSETLGEEIAKLAERGHENYFLCWLNAVERLVESKAVASSAELAGIADAWREAYRNTPHGKPVHLSGGI
ncbi:MAG: nitrile hydratase accessory protein [Gammaproteobacteria bacterium]|nr:nitrile hydratase accessory protein [Gammaproteobacteria bacterium]